MQRRKFLRSASATAIGITILAGCGSPGPGVDGEGTETVGDGVGAETETEMGTEAATETTAGGAADLEGTVGEVPQGLQVSNTELTRADGGAQVTGTVENTGDQAFEEVEVQVTLLDENEEIIGQFFHDTEQAEVSSLEPGQQWEFSVDFPPEDLENAAAYRVDVDTEIDQNVEFDLGTETTTAG